MNLYAIKSQLILNIINNLTHNNKQTLYIQLITILKIFI